MTIPIQPLSDRVLVKPIDPSKVTKGGIHIPAIADADALARRGTVLAVGQGAPLPDGAWRAMSVSAGDVVFYGKFSGIGLDVPGEGQCLVMREDDILARATDPSEGTPPDPG